MEDLLAVVVTTEFRGVFFGWIDPAKMADRTLTLQKCRNAIYWSGKKGFLGLSSHGPEPESRIGSEAPEVLLHQVTSVSECTAEAVEKWRSFECG